MIQEIGNNAHASIKECAANFVTVVSCHAWQARNFHDLASGASIWLDVAGSFSFRRV